MRAKEVVHRWSGQVLEPVDSLAFIGRNPGDEDVYIITGDSGHGMTHATLGAMLICYLINKQPSAWATLYDPSRKAFNAIGAYMKANANVALHFTDWLMPGELSSAEKIPRGEGAIIRNGLELQAVHRDVSGRLHTCSAVCPHLGGVVHWNNAEKSWDCPLHGSRFDQNGECIAGPATSSLKRLGDEAELPSTKSSMTPLQTVKE